MGSFQILCFVFDKTVFHAPVTYSCSRETSWPMMCQGCWHLLRTCGLNPSSTPQAGACPVSSSLNDNCDVVTTLTPKRHQNKGRMQSGREAPFRLFPQWEPVLYLLKSETDAVSLDRLSNVYIAKYVQIYKLSTFFAQILFRKCLKGIS